MSYCLKTIACYCIIHLPAPTKFCVFPPNFGIQFIISVNSYPSAEGWVHIPQCLHYSWITFYRSLVIFHGSVSPNQCTIHDDVQNVGDCVLLLLGALSSKCLVDYWCCRNFEKGSFQLQLLYH